MAAGSLFKGLLLCSVRALHPSCITKPIITVCHVKVRFCLIKFGHGQGVKILHQYKFSMGLFLNYYQQ